MCHSVRKPSSSHKLLPSKGRYHASDMACLPQRRPQLVGVGLASTDRLPVVVRIPAGPLGSLNFFFRPTPYGFRQVVQHVSKHVA